ncbi:MAG: DUF4340 domain-containing protein [Cyclobacteriaceae bacterium]
MPRNVKLLISLIGLSVLASVMFYFGNRDSSGIDKTIFEVVNQDRIDRVALTSQRGTVELKFDGVKWKVNTAYDADRQLITVLFATVVQTQPKRKLTGAQRDSVSKKMSRDGVRVLLSEGETLNKEYLVCGNEEKTETYYQLAGEEEIYLVTIPGYRVYVASIFELGESGWRDKGIFNFNWQNFKELKVHFPQQASQDFSVTLVNNLFSIAEVSVADTTKLSGFLESLFKLRAEQILSKTESARYDSVLNGSPIVELVIQDISKRSFELKIYPPQKGNGLVAGKMNQSETVLLSPRAAAAVSRGRDFFAVK